jgi:hypothetical protein
MHPAPARAPVSIALGADPLTRCTDVVGKNLDGCHRSTGYGDDPLPMTMIRRTRGSSTPQNALPPHARTVPRQKGRLSVGV